MPICDSIDAGYQKAIAALSVAEIPWSKPILRVSNEALFYDKSLEFTLSIKGEFENAKYEVINS